MVRVILFEDNKSYKESLKDFFEDSELVFLSANFSDARKAKKIIREYEPDVVLMDIQMPYMSGIEAIQELKKANIKAKILMLTTFDDNHKIFSAICAGALGYVLKDDELENLEQAIIDVNDGKRYMSPSIAIKAINLFQLVETDTNSNVEYVKLTITEKKVLERLVKGDSYKLVAYSLEKEYHAVHAHIKNIYKKLEVNSKSEAIIKALNNHLI